MMEEWIKKIFTDLMFIGSIIMLIGILFVGYIFNNTSDWQQAYDVGIYGFYIVIGGFFLTSIGYIKNMFSLGDF